MRHPLSPVPFTQGHLQLLYCNLTAAKSLVWNHYNDFGVAQSLHTRVTTSTATNMCQDEIRDSVVY